MIKDLALLDKTDITVRTPLGSVTLAIAKRDDGYACGLWSNDSLLGRTSFRADANMFKKAASIGPLLAKAKEHLGATAQKYPEGLEILVRVEHGGNAHEIPGRIPLDVNQIAQFSELLNWVRKVNDELQNRR